MVVEQARVIIVLKKLDQKMLEEDEIMIYMMVDMMNIDLLGDEGRGGSTARCTVKTNPKDRFYIFLTRTY